MRPLLELLADGREWRVGDTYEPLAQRFTLTEADLREQIPSGTQSLLYNRIQWARTYLAKAGLLESPRRGVVRITEAGRVALASGEVIDNRYLRRFPDFVRFVGGRGVDQPGGDGAGGQEPPVTRTPDELMAEGFQQLQAALASDLLERIRTSSPAFFERLVVDLLVKMGYGGTLDDPGQAIGRTGDEGIDGIIKEDRLGLDVIYVQAKRWNNTVGRPGIQQFAGALQGQRARKGVFITTSTFSAEAREYVRNIDTRIVLIDGEELARLMIAHGVGVTPVAVYEVKRVDSDYFSEE